MFARTIIEHERTLTHFCLENVEHERTRTRVSSKLSNTENTNEHEHPCIFIPEFQLDLVESFFYFLTLEDTRIHV